MVYVEESRPVTSEEHAVSMGGQVEAEPWLRPSRSPTNVFPLNSRRLTGHYMMSIAEAMGLLTRGTVEAMNLIIEGRLSDTGREPQNVQVGVSEAGGGKTTISLQDSRGVFLEADCSQQEVSGSDVDEPGDGPGAGGSGGGTESDSSPNEDVTAELLEVRTQNRQLMTLKDELTTQVSTLKGEVSTLSDKLKRETERVSEVWRISCEQVSSFDEVITEKDAEIDRLRARLTEL